MLRLVRRIPTAFARLTFAAVFATLLPRGARADDGLAYKYSDYRETGGRIAVTTQSVLLEHHFDPDTSLRFMGTVDAITGATPNGQPAPAGSDQVVLTDMHDRRKAWSLAATRQLGHVQLVGEFANSRESDYVSNGWSLNTVTDFNQKNTTLLLGGAGTNDDVKVFYQSPWARKQTADLIAGVTQLLDPNTSWFANLSWGRATGYLNDPYKLVQKSVEVAPGIFLPFTYGESRPDRRTKWVALTGLNRAFPAAHGAVEASARWYHDTFGTTATTAELSWLQSLGPRITLIPHLRYHTQGAADFYHYDLDATALAPTGGAPRPAGPFYSSDYRLSALRATTVSLKLVWAPNARLALDAEVARYVMRGRDGVTAGSAYPTANIATFGVRVSW